MKQLESVLMNLPDLTTRNFETDLLDRHLIYSYNVPAHETDSGRPELWQYELWIHSKNRVVYAIHGGPMAGRKAYQAAKFQCVRPGQIWQINWLEETGTVCSLIYDISEMTMTTLIAASNGHWDNPQATHGNKRNREDLERWRTLAQIGPQTNRTILCEQAKIERDFRGKGDLEDIELDWPVL